MLWHFTLALTYLLTNKHTNIYSFVSASVFVCIKKTIYYRYNSVRVSLYTYMYIVIYNLMLKVEYFKI